VADYYRDLVARLRAAGYEFKRSGRGDHEIWWNAETKSRSPLIASFVLALPQTRFSKKPASQKRSDLSCCDNSPWGRPTETNLPMSGAANSGGGVAFQPDRERHAVLRSRIHDIHACCFDRVGCRGRCHLGD
jgi:hypothetical protein